MTHVVYCDVLDQHFTSDRVSICAIGIRMAIGDLASGVSCGNRGDNSLRGSITKDVI